MEESASKYKWNLQKLKKYKEACEAEKKSYSTSWKRRLSKQRPRESLATRELLRLSNRATNAATRIAWNS